MRTLIGEAGGLRTPGPSAEAYAPANIALCKYWGKRDNELNLPVTASLSISLGRLGTRTRLTPRSGADDRITLNGDPVPADSVFARRLRTFLDPFRAGEAKAFEIETENTIPTAAGLASSASGYAALVMALDRLFGFNWSPAQCSIAARLGSGSACRSIGHGFYRWNRGEREDGMDSFAVPVDTPWPELRIGLLHISSGEKNISSRDAMKRTVETSPLYREWPGKVERDLPRLAEALADRNLHIAGAVSENNALSMHATSLGAWPPVLFWLPETVEKLHAVWQARADGLSVYATMDAGPNIKLLYEASAEPAIRERFPTLEPVSPFEEMPEKSPGAVSGSRVD